MWIVSGVLRQVPHRWPIVFVAPVLVYAGYTSVQTAMLTGLAAIVAEVLFVIVEVLLPDRR